MRKHRFAWGLSMLAVATLVLAACSDVEEGGETTDGGDTGSLGGRAVRQRHDHDRGEPMGRRRGERRRRARP